MRGYAGLAFLAWRFQGSAGGPSAVCEFLLSLCSIYAVYMQYVCRGAPRPPPESNARHPQSHPDIFHVSPMISILNPMFMVLDPMFSVSVREQDP